MSSVRMKMIYGFLLLLPVLATAKTYFLVGVNGSSFTTDNVAPNLGYNITIGKDWRIYKSLGLCLESSLSRRQCVLKNKSVGAGDPSPFPLPYDEIALYDIDVSLLNIDVPLLLRFELTRAAFKVVVFGGYGITANLSNDTISTVTRKIIPPDNFEFDYRGRRFGEDYKYGGFISSHIGVRVLRTPYVIEVRYLGTDIYSCQDYNLGGEKLYSIIVNFGFAI